MSYTRRTKDQLAARVAQDIPEGATVNLGIGMPTTVGNHIPASREVLDHERCSSVNATADATAVVVDACMSIDQ